MKTIGIFADNVTMPTGMAIVCKNLALGLSNYPVRVIYFGRFGQQSGVGKEPILHENSINYDLVPTEGGVWRPRTVITAIEQYDVDIVFTEDDFFSAGGLVRASKKTNKPLHFLTPIDSLPINPMAYRVFKECFIKGTFVNTPLGIKKIENVHNDFILDNKNGKQIPIDSFSRNYNGELIRIKARGMFPVHVTPEHPFKVVERIICSYGRRCPHYVYSITKSQWKEAKELKTKRKRNQNGYIIDCLVFPKFKKIKTKTMLDGIKINSQTARLMGLWLAEGCFSIIRKKHKLKNGEQKIYEYKNSQWCFGKHEKTLIHFVMETLKKELKLVSRKHDQNNATTITVRGDILYDFLMKNFGSLAVNKRIPRFIMEAPENIIKPFIRGYLEGDGWIDYKERLGSFTTASPNIAFSLQKLFSKIDELANITRVKPKKTIMGRKILSPLSEHFRITIGPTALFKLGYNVTPRQRHPPYEEDENNFYLPIVKIDKIKYNGKVYNLTTPNGTYQVSGVVTHNCEKVYVPNSSYKLIKNGVFLPHGVDREVFYPKRLYRDPDLFTFVWIGRDEPRKAMGRFIFAVEKALKKIDFQVIIHSDWRANLAIRTARYLRYKRDLPVIMTQMEAGGQEQLNRIYNTTDVLVCTSKAGACEMSQLEAMACGKPVITTDWTFMNEVVENYENGFKIPVASVCGDTAILYNGKRWGVPLGRKWGNISINALADAMRYCVDNPDVVNRMSETTFKYVERYDWRKIAGKLYREIME